MADVELETIRTLKRTRTYIELALLALGDYNELTNVDDRFANDASRDLHSVLLRMNKRLESHKATNMSLDDKKAMNTLYDE